MDASTVGQGTFAMLLTGFTCMVQLTGTQLLAFVVVLDEVVDVELVVVVLLLLLVLLVVLVLLVDVFVDVELVVTVVTVACSTVG